MPLRALRIVQEEFADTLSKTHEIVLNTSEGASNASRLLDPLLKRIRDRIEAECLDQPDDEHEIVPACIFCGRTEKGCNTFVSEVDVDPDAAVRSSETTGRPVCVFCMRTKEGCHGGGGPDGDPAHDFTASNEQAEAPDTDVYKDD